MVWYLEKYVGDQFNGLETETFTWFDCFYYVTTTLATGAQPRHDGSHRHSVGCVTRGGDGVDVSVVVCSGVR